VGTPGCGPPLQEAQGGHQHRQEPRFQQQAVPAGSTAVPCRRRAASSARGQGSPPPRPPPWGSLTTGSRGRPAPPAEGAERSAGRRFGPRAHPVLRGQQKGQPQTPPRQLQAHGAEQWPPLAAERGSSGRDGDGRGRSPGRRAGTTARDRSAPAPGALPRAPQRHQRAGRGLQGTAGRAEGLQLSLPTPQLPQFPHQTGNAAEKAPVPPRPALLWEQRSAGGEGAEARGLSLQHRLKRERGEEGPAAAGRGGGRAAAPQPLRYRAPAGRTHRGLPGPARAANPSGAPAPKHGPGGSAGLPVGQSSVPGRPWAVRRGWGSQAAPQHGRNLAPTAGTPRSRPPDPAPCRHRCRARPEPRQESSSLG